MDRNLLEVINEDTKVNGNNKRTISFLKYYRKMQFYRNRSSIRYYVNKCIFYFKFRYTGVELKDSLSIGKGIRMPHLNSIIVSEYAIIGDFCTIFQQVTIGSNEHKSNYKTAPHIGNNVYIGAGAKIIGNIHIGDGVIIGANAVVTKDVPDGMTVIGFNNFITSHPERRP